MLNRILFIAAIIFSCVCPAAAAETKSGSFHAGIELFHFAYREPGLMSEDGFFYGVALAYEQREPSFWKLEGRLSHGQVDYTGSLSDGTPLTIDNINDYIFEVRSLFGLRRRNSPVSPMTPYLGLGYRYLWDNSAERHPSGYLRESNYIYIPIGLERRPEGGSGWSTGFSLEYDLFVWGKQISHLSDVNPGYSDAANEQSSGYGLRGSIQILRKGEDNDLIIEPYFRYWDIDESDVDLVTLNGAPYRYVVEPDNEHREIGVRFLLQF